MGVKAVLPQCCPSTAFFCYSNWQKNTNIHYQAGFNSIDVWNIVLSILDLSGSLFKTEKRHLDFCLKMFITASKKVLSICQTHSVTTYLDQVQMFLLPQIYIRSQTRKRERLLFFFLPSLAQPPSGQIDLICGAVGLFSLWSYLSAFREHRATRKQARWISTYKHVLCPPCTARQAMPSTGKFFHCLHGCWLFLERHLLEHISAVC